MQISTSSIPMAINSPSLTQPHRTSHFSQWLSPTDAATDRTAKTDHDQTQEAAEGLVSITLIQPLLAQARQDPFRTELFHGGSSEDTFGAQLDSILAQRITQGAALPIVDAVYDQLATTGNKVNTHG